MISIENISKSFGGQVLFEETGFRLNRRERVGLTGRNGHGKTTLFRLITGEEIPDAGTIIIPKNYRIGYVRQNLEFTEPTLLKEGMKGLPQEEKDHSWKVEKILFGLGFSLSDMERSPLVFSGGFQVRLNLAKILVSEPDLLLLDEPTNYLDITSIRWITRFLNLWPRELMLITHDRGFMDKVVTHTIAIHRRKMRKIEGDTGKLYTQIAMDEEIYEKTRMNDEQRKKQIELFISRFRAKARLANMVQSRIKTIEKMEKKDKLERIKTLDFTFKNQPFKGKYVITAQNLSFSYDGTIPLIRNLSFSIGARERICIIGKNGKGKTTLLRLLAGSLKPLSGEIAYHPTVITGIYEQTHIQTLVDSRTVAEEILYSDQGMDQQTARNIAGVMMFEGDSALKKVSVLSGGEKSRVMLGKLLATPLNLLLLDEPTNHLDMESCDALLAAIDNFDGAVIMVTHNEMFLHALAERLIVFHDDEIEVFEGGYAQFLEKDGWRDAEIGMSGQEKADVSENGKSDGPKPNRKEIRRLRSEVIAERSRVLRPLEKRIAEIENEIESREKQMQDIHAALQDASEKQDGPRIASLSIALHECQTAIDKGFEELEILTEQQERESAGFDQRMKELQLLE
jgi:ATP-binding cassette subfamily F protein 3